jgi:hypothetical protein
MFINKKTISAFVIFMCCIGKNVYAESVHACNVGCNNVDSKAMVISMRYGQGEMFSVVNYKNSTAHTYLADKYFDSNGEFYDRVIKLSPSSTAHAALVFYLNISAQAKALTIELPTNLPNTPRDDNYTASIVMINTPQSRDEIAVWIALNASIASQIDVLLGQLASKITDAVGASIDVRIQVTFDDGSTADFDGVNRQINGLITREYDYIEGSAKFSNGNTVPRTAGNVIGNWFFSSEFDAASFSRLGSLWNVTMRESLTCKPTTEFECKVVANETVCTTHQKCE